MDDLITQVCTKLKMDETVAKQAIGAILVFLKEQVALYGKEGTFDFSAITDKLKGALELMNQAPKDPQQAKRDADMNSQERQNSKEEGDDAPPTTSSTNTSMFQSVVSILQYMLTIGPIFDILKKLLNTIFGESAVQMLESSKDSANLMAILSNLGISQETGKKITTLLVTYMRKKVGPETVEKLGECVPALKPFLEASEKDE